MQHKGKKKHERRREKKERTTENESTIPRSGTFISFARMQKK